MKKILIFLFVIILLTNICGCKNKTNSMNKNGEDTYYISNDNYRVFYQIFVGSFSDSNNDTYGDLRGIINRIDYLNDGDLSSTDSLHVEGIWLSPIFESPTYHKYDVIDYYKIDETFGTIEDLKELIQLCHERNIKIILDFPINHTSSKCSWFLNFKNARLINDKTSKYYDYYTCVTSDEKVSGRQYYSLSSGSDYYFEGNFESGMPELNFDNEDVYNEYLNIAKYYLDLGIDGFRFDAAKYIYYGDTTKTVEFWKKYIGDLKKINSEIYTVGEVWSNDSETLNYVEALNCFDFSLSGAEGVIAKAVKNGKLSSYINYVSRYLSLLKEKNNDSMMISFISNHDMDRSAGYLFVSQFQAQMAANLNILSPGSPFIYYGEEIGLRGSRGSANTDSNRRLKMLWGDGDNVGDPIGATYEVSKQINGTVKDQEEDENSILNYYRKLIKLRNKYPEIGRGSYSPIILDSDDVGGFLIEYSGSKTIIIHNVSSNEMNVDLSEYLIDGMMLKDYIGLNTASLNDKNLVIGPYTSVIIK